MHIKAIQVFCDVVARRSFSRAADENGITQSAASQIVNQLEQRLGVRLLDRSKRPFVLTAAGQVYYDESHKLLRRYKALEEEVQTLQQEVSGRVSIASIYSVGLSHMNRFVQGFLARHPKANVRVEYQHPDRVYEMVEADQVDFGLVSYGRSSRHFSARAWREEPMVVVCSPDHGWSARGTVGARELQGVPFIGFDPDLKIRQQVDKAFAAVGVHLDVVMEFDNIETLKRAVEINTGVSLLPAPTIERELMLGSLHQLELSDVSLIRPISIIQRRNGELGKTARRFLQDLLNWEPIENRGVPREHAIATPNDTPCQRSVISGATGAEARDADRAAANVALEHKTESETRSAQP